MKAADAEWGPIFVQAGPYRGRIGDLDDDDGDRGTVYFGTIQFHYLQADIPFKNLRPVATDDLLRRSEEIGHKIPLRASGIDINDELDLLYEYHYISQVLQNRWLQAQESFKGDFGVFLSHSSADKERVRWIAVDLGNHGYRPWLDEWEIFPGESIPKRLSDGIEGCRVMLVALSPHAVASEWVEREWHAKYWAEVEERHVSVIPIMLAKCHVPPLLRFKKYADFTISFNEGMDDLLKGLKRIASKSGSSDADS